MDGMSMGTVLLQILVLFALAKVGGLICERFGISSVIGEIAAGIIVANTVLFQWLSLDLDMSLFEILSELGVIFLLFAVGLETPFSELRKVGRTATLVAVLGVIIPFFAGFALILGLGHLQTEAMFIGAAMVATSVGITARVIKDMDLTRSIESRVIIGAAVIDDVLGMIVLAIVVGIANGGSNGILDIVLVSATGIAFVLLVIFFGSIVLPNARKRVNGKSVPVTDDSTVCVKKRKFTITALPLAIIICLVLSYAASLVGLAAIIGAFLAGMAFAEFKDKWPCDEDFKPINAFLVPFFFLFVGMSVSLSSFSDVLLIAVAITLLAIVTKYIGCSLGSLKLGRGSANIIGVGMVPRGEVGIIVATIGLGMGVVSQNLFSVVVFMSMATTIVAPFLLTWAFRRKYGECPNGEPAEVERVGAQHQ
ncbi:MAG: cation:proton antiporter [Methanomassiliicoccus sp.]|nr:cation:proton antiporter [Methanomassiliicoccus sp.]